MNNIPSNARTPSGKYRVLYMGQIHIASIADGSPSITDTTILAVRDAENIVNPRKGRCMEVFASDVQFFSHFNRHT